MGLAKLMAALTIPSLALQAAAPMPLNLPRPDGKPGGVTKPVKVYLLAGQSNMNGMGDHTGARPPYPSVFLSADPAILPGVIVAWRREGRRPRGSHVYREFRDEFKGGKVTIAVSNFPMDNRPIDRLIPPGDTLSVWMEEMKLPPLMQ
jgi:hypothetical protein